MRGVRMFGTLAVSLFGVGCSSTISAVPGEETDSFRLTVIVTNTGDGFGRVDVDFVDGVTQEPCDRALGPGERCTPFVVLSRASTGAEVSVAAEAGSRFAGWGGEQCSGLSTECTLANGTAETDAIIQVEARFELEPPTR